MSSRMIIIAIVLIAIVAGASLLIYRSEQSASANRCQPLGDAKVLRSQLSKTTFDAMTEFGLPTPLRWPNAITVAPDGSVWFGEESVPGVAHLFTNGTLVEYAWPISLPHLERGVCATADIWGIALWNGMVWGTYMEANSIIGLNPTKDTFQIINISQSASDPYTLTVGPDGDLWFTMISSPAQIGRISAGGTYTLLKFTNYTTFLPTGIQFLNRSSAYYVGVNFPQDNGGLFDFDPQGSSSSVTPHEVGENLDLQSPNALALSPTGIWISEHGPARVVSFNLTSGVWTAYPTSTVSYYDTTLPYFIVANGSQIWFNEHYGNRIAVIDSSSETLTEYSEANPPATNGTQIGNALTIASGGTGIWFTAITANDIGFANAAYSPSFSISPAESNELTLAAGQQGSVELRVAGTATGALAVLTSDSENFTSIPAAIGIAPSTNSIVANGTAQTLEVVVSVGSALSPGEYTLDVTLTNGLISRTAFIFLTVS